MFPTQTSRSQPNSSPAGVPCIDTPGDKILLLLCKALGTLGLLMGRFLLRVWLLVKPHSLQEYAPPPEMRGSAAETTAAPLHFDALCLAAEEAFPEDVRRPLAAAFLPDPDIPSKSNLALNALSSDPSSSDRRDIPESVPAMQVQTFSHNLVLADSLPRWPDPASPYEERERYSSPLGEFEGGFATTYTPTFRNANDLAVFLFMLKLSMTLALLLPRWKRRL